MSVRRWNYGSQLGVNRANIDMPHGTFMQKSRDLIRQDRKARFEYERNKFADWVTTSLPICQTVWPLPCRPDSNRSCWLTVTGLNLESCRQEVCVCVCLCLCAHCTQSEWAVTAAVCWEEEMVEEGGYWTEFDNHVPGVTVIVGFILKSRLPKWNRKPGPTDHI